MHTTQMRYESEFTDHAQVFSRFFKIATTCAIGCIPQPTPDRKQEAKMKMSPGLWVRAAFYATFAGLQTLLKQSEGAQ